MSSKQLTARVRIDSTGALRSLDAILRKINQINGAASRTSNAMSGMSNQLNNGSRAMNNVASQAQRTHSLFSRLQGAAGKIGTMITRIGQGFGNFVPKIGNVVRQHFSWSDILSRIRSGYDRIRSVGQNVGSSVKNWFTNQLSVESSAQRTNGILGSIWQKLKGIAATYLGIMGAKAVIGTADTITSAENKLNYVNGYDVQATQASMDKMYNSAQKVRMSYTDMMSNVSKSMALAEKSFKGNIDNAIRFQEIMAEAYAVGGASAQEMHSSMYQMIQALGSGILAGDELRSVREGAPLAYKAIEKFAQGVYDCEDSLKDMASQGKITSDMVVAGILNAGDELDTAFAQTAQTFAQTWTQIKNVAKKAFEPVARMMRDMLNKAIDNGLIDKVETMFVGIAKAFQIVFKVIANAITWITDNWSWLKDIIVSGLIAIGLILAYTAIAGIVNWLILNHTMVLVFLSLTAIIYAVYAWKQGTIDSCTAIGIALLGIAVILFLIFGWQVALVVAAIALAIMFFQYVCAIVFAIVAIVIDAILIVLNIIIWLVNVIFALIAALVAIIVNIIAFIVNCIAVAINVIATIIQWIIAFIVNLTMGCVNWIVALVTNCINGIINLGVGLWNAFKAICQNIGIAFENAWNGALSAFWNFIANCLDGLKCLEGPLNAIASLFGKGGISISGLASGARTKASSYGQKGYVSVSTAFSDGMDTKSYESLSDAWSSGWNTMDYNSMGDAISSGWNSMDYVSVDDAWSNGYNSLEYADLINIGDAWNSGLEFGNNVKDYVNELGGNLRDKVSDKLGDKFNLDSIGESLGLDLGNITKDTLFPDTGLDYSNPSDLLDDVDGIGKDTGKIADAMELTEEDLEYLRKIAEMEWKKEYTTAEIKVDMSNYNTINGDSDLDGIVTKLTDKLYEELASVADGVYV